MGKRNKHTFVKGDPKAIANGKKSSRKLPEGLREARQIRAIEFENIIYKYLDKTPEEIAEIIKIKGTTPTKELIVLKLVSLALEHGDLSRLNFLLDRTIGKVPEKLEASVTTKSLHDQIIDAIENDNGESDK